MAIAFDNYTQNNAVTTSLTISHTSTGSDIFMVIGITLISASDVVTGVTQAGNTCTQENTVTIGSEREYIFFKDVSVVTGAQDVVISISVSTNTIGKVSTYTGALQSSGADNSEVNSCTSCTTLDVFSVTNTVADNSWIIASCRNNASNWIVNANSTIREVESFTILDSNAPITPAGALAIGGTFSSGSAVMCGISIAPAAVVAAEPAIFFGANF